MNTQSHSSLLYKMIPYQVFFGRKYRDRDKSLVTLSEVSLEPVNMTDQSINNKVNQRLSIIDEVIKKFFEY